MATLEVSDYLIQTFSEFRYAAPFLVLLLCGVGLPLPEEIPLIGVGILLFRGEVEFLPSAALCSAAILIGDSIPFWLGRRYGMAAVRLRWVRAILHPERFSRMERRFEAHGNWATFVCRFLSGIRIPGYFVAGTMRMSYLRFLVLDGLGVLITVPLWIGLGFVFGEQVEQLGANIGDFHLLLAFLVLTLALILVIRSRRARLALKEARLRERAARLEAARIAREKQAPDSGRPDGSGA